VDLPAPAFDPNVRPWRTATLIVSGIAAIEFLLLVAIGVIVLGRPFLDDSGTSAQRKAKPAPAATSKTTKATPQRRAQAVARPKLARSETSVLVLNGNGREGAAGAEAQIVRARGYGVAAVGNARRADYSRSLVMYRPGYKADGLRLAGDLRIKLVTPLDGLRNSDLKGAHLAVIVGR
jgi:hypothetical protein